MYKPVCLAGHSRSAKHQNEYSVLHVHENEGVQCLTQWVFDPEMMKYEAQKVHEKHTKCYDEDMLSNEGTWCTTGNTWGVFQSTMSA